MYQLIIHTLSIIKKSRPLILNITNDVTMDFIANGLLSIGAAPVMSKSIEEIEALIKVAAVVVINIGTLDVNFIELCERACAFANQFQKPIILDPVGAGATSYRTDAAIKLLSQFSIAIVRGNAGEILSLSGALHHTKGVDSLIQSETIISEAKYISKKFNTAVVVSGATDLIFDQDNMQFFSRGSHFMPFVTGTGCLLSAIVGAFHAVHDNRFEASVASTLFYSVCGEIAATMSQGPGSFKMAFLDALNKQPLEMHYDIH